MAKVISIEERRLLRGMQSEVISPVAEMTEHPIVTYSSLNEWLREVISGEIIRRKEVSEEIFLCGIYIAAMLAKVGCDLKNYAVDFLEKWTTSADPEYLKKGGDFCFVLCGGFAARCDRRMMTLKDYQEMGASFYDWFYSSTGKVIGHYMSVNFEVMQDVVRSALRGGYRRG